MDFEKIIYGIRHAIYGREVREYLAKIAEWIKAFVEQQVAKMEDLLKKAQTSEKNAAASATASAASAKASADSAASSKGSADASAKSAAASAASAAAAKTSETNAAASAVKSENSANSSKKYSELAKTVINDAKNAYGGGYYRQYVLCAVQNGWKRLNPAKGTYIYYQDIAIEGITDRFAPFAAMTIESYAYATEAGVAHTVETLTDKIRLYSMAVPKADLDFVLTLFGIGTKCYELTIEPNDWKLLDSPIGLNRYYADMDAPECTTGLTPIGMTCLENYEAAMPAGMASICESLTGAVRFYAVRRPTANIDVSVALIKKDDPINTPATRTELGLVKIGDGMDVESTGRISTRGATDAEWAAAMNEVFN